MPHQEFILSICDFEWLTTFTDGGLNYQTKQNDNIFVPHTWHVLIQTWVRGKVMYFVTTNNLWLKIHVLITMHQIQCTMPPYVVHICCAMHQTDVQGASACIKYMYYALKKYWIHKSCIVLNTCSMPCIKCNVPYHVLNTCTMPCIKSINHALYWKPVPYLECIECMYHALYLIHVPCLVSSP